MSARECLCGDAVEAKVRPQRRADEAHSLDGHRCGVEQRHGVHRARVCEDLPRLVDVTAVELVIAGDVQRVLAREPFVHRIAEQPEPCGRSQVARDDQHVRFGRERRDWISVLEVQVGDHLDSHGGFSTVADAGADRLVRAGPFRSAPPARRRRAGR